MGWFWHFRHVMSTHLKHHLLARQTWLRGLYMLLFVLIYSLAEVLAATVAVFQFGCVLLTGRPQARLGLFAADLGVYLWQVWRFLLFVQEEIPFPFAPWPRGTPAPHHGAGE